MTHQERHARLAVLYEEIGKLKRECPHYVAPKVPGEYHNGFAICEGCGESFGWYCPDAPDHTCHYYSFNGLVVDVHTDVAMPVPAGHNPAHEGYGCIFCGNPDERK